MPAPQTHANHGRRDLPYLALMVLGLTLTIAAFVHLGYRHDFLHWMLAGLSLAAWSAGIAARHYGLKNQDRLIRLEENVRMHWMNIDPSGLTMRQMIALRFAPDAELAGLVARAKAEHLSGKQIKAAITNWRADHDRA